jgi:flagellar hook assembly protein FlgD
VSQSEPNPFVDRTEVKYGLPQSSNVHIVIYNPLGQYARTLVDEKADAGTHTVIWDGRDDSGRELRSGVYLCKIQAGDYTQTRKVILLR